MDQKCDRCREIGAGFNDDGDWLCEDCLFSDIMSAGMKAKAANDASAPNPQADEGAWSGADYGDDELEQVALRNPDGTLETVAVQPHKPKRNRAKYMRDYRAQKKAEREAAKG